MQCKRLLFSGTFSNIAVILAVISINNIVIGSVYKNHRGERNSKAARSRESVSPALVKAFQVFHPTNFELLQRRARRL